MLGGGSPDQDANDGAAVRRDSLCVVQSGGKEGLDLTGVVMTGHMYLYKPSSSYT